MELQQRQQQQQQHFQLHEDGVFVQDKISAPHQATREERLRSVK